MESVLVFFVSISLLIISMMTMSMTNLQSNAKVATTWKAMEARTNTIRQTQIVSVAPDNYRGGTIDITVLNQGQMNLSDFAHWDVIIEDQYSTAKYLAYSGSYPPANNCWALKGIYIGSGTFEIFDINILNPGEQAVIGLHPSEMIYKGDTARITISTASGVTSQCFVIQH